MPGIWGRLMTGIRAGVTAYRESSFSSAEMSAAARAIGGWASYDARLQRYSVYWALYENSIYRDTLNLYATKLKADLGLYRHIRSIYNPAFRLGEFWATHLMGGAYDPAAGDGDETPSSLPIVTTNTAIRPAIERLWRDSNWQVGKSIWSRYGAVMGDAPLKVVDDPEKGRVSLVPIDPRKLRDFVVDSAGNIKAYALEEYRDDPLLPGQKVRYVETAERDGETVIYRTYRGEGMALFAWDPNPAEWTVDYGFVPMVWAQHLNVGAGSGWSELHSDRSKIFEVDDQASNLSDFVRRMVNAPWVLSGAKAPEQPLSIHPNFSQASQAPPVGMTDSRTKDKQGMLYLPDPQARPHALVTDLNIADVTANILALTDEIERDYPELRFDKLRASGDASGEALRIARQPAEAKVLARRSGYDDALVRAQMMALAIGGFRGYDQYQGFSLDSYNAGALDHTVGPRPVFDLDEIDRISDETARATALKAMVDAGVPLASAMRRAGYKPDEIQQAEAEKAANDARAEALARQQANTQTDARNSNQPVIA